MKSPLSLFTLSICFVLMFSCGKTDSVEPTADNILLKTDCLTETSEVAYKDQSTLNTDGFVPINAIIPQMVSLKKIVMLF
ncbi:MAG: hypothetical protein V4585_06920 [Bacteroidota bacterium]